MAEIAQAPMMRRKIIKGPTKCRPGKGSCAMLSTVLAETSQLLPKTGGAGLGIAIRIGNGKATTPITYSTGKGPKASHILIDFCPWCGMRLSEAPA